MARVVKHLFAPVDAGGEVFESLLSGTRFRLERIVSQGQASPPDFWYDQSEDEWVALLQGTARLVFDREEALELRAGDAVLIEAGCRHRVEECSSDAIWLALHGHFQEVAGRGKS